MAAAEEGEGNDGDGFVRVATLHDHVKADMVRALLESADIPVLVPGSQFRAVEGGFLAAFIELPVMVPRRYAEEAAELIRSVEEGVPVEDDAGWPVAPEPVAPEPALHPGPSAAKPDSPRLRRIAAFCSLALTFGTGHFYAREHVSGIVLLCAEVCAIWAAFGSAAGAAVTLPLIVAIDFVGSIFAVSRQRSGRRWTPIMQLFTTGFAVVLAFLVGLVGVPRIRQLQAEAAEEAAAVRHPDESSDVEILDPADIDWGNASAGDEAEGAREGRFDLVGPGGYLDLHEPAAPVGPPPEATVDP